ncbi:MAG: hypothetical protein IIT56_01415 [Bacteroidales bacterium]|nr:hypothetical protein [Bacteroidales bacterium]
MAQTQKENELIGQVSETQIQAWKKQWGEVFAVKADGKICYLRKPDRKILAYTSTLANNPIKANETLLNNCWLGGCEDFKTDDSLFRRPSIRRRRCRTGRIHCPRGLPGHCRPGTSCSG